MSGKDDKFFFGTDNTNLTIDEYIKKVNDIAEYYFESCEKYKKKFYTSCFIRMIASALIPVISLAFAVNWSTVVVSILASLITVTEGYVNVTRSYEKWTKYRETCNSLWFEQRQFAIKAGVYSNVAYREEIFIERCEGIMLAETNEWKKYIERAKDMK